MILINVINPNVDRALLTAWCSTEDCILLRQDGVYLANQTSLIFPGKLLALASDVAWRNIAVAPHITVIDDAEWVRLSAIADKTLLWY